MSERESRSKPGEEEFHGIIVNGSKSRWLYATLCNVLDMSVLRGL